MRILIICIVLPVLLLSCSGRSGSGRTGSSRESKLKEQVISVAGDYIRGQLSDPEETVSEDGIITLEDTLKRYVIDPSMIFPGLIDNDRKTDAIVSVSTFNNQSETVSQQLVVLGSDKGLRLSVAIESDMRIISIKNGIITADVPEHSRNTPLFHCPSCWEVVKFRFEKGELKRIEE